MGRLAGKAAIVTGAGSGIEPPSPPRDPARGAQDDRAERRLDRARRFAGQPVEIAAMALFLGRRIATFASGSSSAPARSARTEPRSAPASSMRPRW